MLDLDAIKARAGAVPPAPPPQRDRFDIDNGMYLFGYPEEVNRALAATAQAEGDRLALIAEVERLRAIEQAARRLTGSIWLRRGAYVYVQAPLFRALFRAQGLRHPYLD